MSEPEIVQVVKVYQTTIERRGNIFGGYDIVFCTDMDGKKDEFVAVQTHYSYAYMDNSRSHWISEAIEKLLKGEVILVEKVTK